MRGNSPHWRFVGTLSRFVSKRAELVGIEDERAARHGSVVSPMAKELPPEAPPSKPRAHANKQCLSFPAPMLREIEDEASRLERSISWVVQRAWLLARTEIKKLDPT